MIVSNKQNYSQCNLLFVSVIQNTNQLLQNSTNFEISCNEIQRQCTLIGTHINNMLEKCSNQHQVLKTKLIDVVGKEVTVQNQLRFTNQKVLEFQDKMSGLENKETALSAEIRKAAKTIGSIKKQIEEERQIRSDASHEWIPGITFLKGVFTSDGDKILKGLIPGYNFYQAARGIGSHISQEKERLESVLDSKASKKDELVTEKDSATADIEEKLGEIQSLNCEKKFLSEHHELLESQEKALGKKITLLANSQKTLKTISQQSLLLKGNTSTFPLLRGEQEMLRSKVSSFVSCCNEVTKMLHSVEMIDTSEIERIDRQIKDVCIQNIKREMHEKADGVGARYGWTLETMYNKTKEYYNLAGFSGSIFIIDKTKTTSGWDWSQGCTVKEQYKGKHFHVYCGLSTGSWIRFSDKEKTWSWKGYSVQGDKNYQTSSGHSYIVDFT